MEYVIKNIISFYEEKKGIFFFFMICLFVTSFFALYIYAQYESSKIDITDISQLKDSAVYIYLTEDFDYDEFESALEPQLGKLSVGDYAYIFSQDNYESEYDNNDVELMKDESYFLMAYPSKEHETDEIQAYNSRIYTGKGITNDEIENGSNVCLVSGSFMSEHITIEGTDYTVKGAYDTSDNLSFGIMSYESARKNALTPQRVMLLLDGIDYKNYVTLTAKTVEKLDELFPEYSIESTAQEGSYTIRLGKGKYMSNDNLMLIGMIVLTFITLCSLYSFIFNLREAKYAIFKICGADNRDITRICICEMMLLFNVCFAAAAGVFALLNKTVLYKFQPGFAFKVRPLTYLVCYLVMLTLMLLVFGIFSAVKGRTSPVRMLADGKLLD